MSELEYDKKMYLWNLGYYSTKWAFIWTLRIFLVGLVAIILIALFLGSAVGEAKRREEARG